MPPQGPGMVGALPRPAWGAVLDILSSPDGPPDLSGRAAVLNLRRTCKALAELVAAGCVGGAGRLSVQAADEAAQLETAATAGLGRALVVLAMLPNDLPLLEQEALALARARALALAVERGHMIVFGASRGKCDPAVARMIEAALIEASREGRLMNADLCMGESSGWSVDAMAQLSVVKLSSPKRETVAALAAGALRRVELWEAMWTDMSILSSLREVNLSYCAIEDLTALADVSTLIFFGCYNIKALPAMRNDVLVIDSCGALADVSGLARGRVERLELLRMSNVADVSAIGAMQPPPRTVILEEIENLQDVSMLVGIHILGLGYCSQLDKTATLAALEGKVGAIRWWGDPE